MQNNIDYWKRRQIREAFNVFSQAEIAADEIAKLYIKASAYMTAKMQGVYDKFKRKYGLTDEQAKQLLAAARDRGSIDAALQALQNGPQTESVTELRKVVESAAYAARIRQMRELELSAGQVMNAIYKQELAKNSALYQKLITDSYRKSIFAIQQRAGVAFSFSDVNPKLMERLLHSKWSGKNYSVRLWGNTQEVAENVKEQIILGALTGKTEREMAEALNETFAKGARASRRLIRTESNYIFTQADMAARKECDIRRYMYLATLDMKTCAETCGKLDGRIFLVKDQKPGYNCPPMHPWCRCTTLAILSDEWIRTQTRRARDPETGRTFKVPLSMTYEEWYKKYVSGNPEVLKKVQAEKRRQYDQKQYQRFKEILGDDAPKNLEQFQDIKYNNTEAWNALKLAYKDRKLLKEIRETYNLKIHDGKQGKHILGHNNYSGKSYLLPQVDPQKLVDKFAGTGAIKRDRSGKWIHRQFFMNNQPIGIVVDQNTGEEIPTRYFSIEYSKKDGTHVVPRKEPDHNGNG